MKINKIKKKGGIYKIYLDDKVINTYDEVILKYNLLYKQTLDEDLISKCDYTRLNPTSDILCV